MPRTRKRGLLVTSGTLLVSLCGCPSTIGSADQDATPDMLDVTTLDEPRADVAIERSAPDRVVPDMVVVTDMEDVTENEPPTDIAEEPRESMDVPDVSVVDMLDASPDVEATVDVPVDRSCPRDPPSGPPPNVGRSCGPGRAPLWQCGEVGYCAGSFTMGNTNAWTVNIGFELPFDFLMRPCDLHTAYVHGGYIDTYEVTVARFRAWVEAGMPFPRRNELLLPYLAWPGDEASPLPTYVDRPKMLGGVPETNAMCTWSPVHGVNDNLPINCTDFALAAAFCWWDGKHLATEVAWEYVATNEGTTPTPLGRIVRGAEGCEYGDVGAVNGLCARRDLPMPVGSHPRGVTLHPPGVHDLWGGVREMTTGTSLPYAYSRPASITCRSTASTVYDWDLGIGDNRSGYLQWRGATWYSDTTYHERFSHIASRSGYNGERSVRNGIRCMRWVTAGP
jgi:formylglycine-generating enzyme required for sulfatase activity